MDRSSRTILTMALAVRAAASLTTCTSAKYFCTALFSAVWKGEPQNALMTAWMATVWIIDFILASRLSSFARLRTLRVVWSSLPLRLRYSRSVRTLYQPSYSTNWTGWVIPTRGVVLPISACRWNRRAYLHPPLFWSVQPIHLFQSAMTEPRWTDF